MIEKNLLLIHGTHAALETSTFLRKGQIPQFVHPTF
jgi:hypothetical protein